MCLYRGNTVSTRDISLTYGGLHGLQIIVSSRYVLRSSVVIVGPPKSASGGRREKKKLEISLAQGRRLHPQIPNTLSAGPGRGG